MKKATTKTSLFHSAIALLLCISMLIGSTFAWFSDSISSGKNIITAGNLDLEMYWTDDLNSGEWHNVEENGHNTIFNYDNWEPGYTDVKYIKLVNAGDLALNYELTLTPQNGVGKLAEVINVYFAEGGVAVEQRSDLKNLKAIGLLNNVLNGGATADGTLLAADQESPLHPSGEVIMTVAMNMITTAGNDYMNEDAGMFTITALATQAVFESDSFGSDYDADAEYSTLLIGGSASASVTPVDGKVPAGGVTISGDGISAYLPEGVALENGTNKVTLKVTPLKNTTSDITVVNNEILIPVDVHIDGVAEGNTVPIIIDLGEVLPKYLNMGNYRLFHVEDGINNEMTLVADKTALIAHNQFTYDSDTGAVSVAMASFSEVAMVADTVNPWNGETAEDWDENAEVLTIANGDELNAFSKAVGAGKDFAGKTVTLLADINLNGSEHIFYPIGYYNNQENKYDRDNASGLKDVESSVSAFSGTFNGNGHTISNFYQNTWEMFGDYNSGYTGTPNYYKDAMGLFGYVLNGTVKNLTVDHFSSDGEFTPTGVIAAYAVNSTFENIAITNCNPRVYNTGNGGIVGIGGDSSDTKDSKLIFKNITIDNTNKISALWGSWNVACGGLMGMFFGPDDVANASRIEMTNCHVAAQIDVYNDVCGNYQYYWYRYSGMMVGTIDYHKTENGYTVPDTSMITAESCTVHFGDWNDYYYCELVANSLASYTHDHQFSRLTEISSLDEIKSGDTWTATGNYLLIDGDTKTCYHIVKSGDGTLTRHLHEDAGEETVNGKTVLKEDKQIIYLPFNQLFTGYGWGVKNIPVYNGKDYAFEGITILDRENADSVTKFEKADTAHDSYKTGGTVTIGELFKAMTIEDSKLTIKSENVQVTVSPAYGTDSTAGATYTANTTDWTQGTLTFSGLGAATITITDYYFCTPTTITITVAEPDSVDKFDLVFENTDDYLYRVGNQNTVSLGSLFKAKDGVEIGNVTVTVNELNGATVSGTYIPNASEWQKGKIQFTGTGPVLVTIDDDAYANEKVLYLEVVDGYNVTAYSELKNRNSVLLNDITMSSGSSYYLSGATLYGNGFTFDMTDGTYAAGGNTSSNYVFGLNNANLDNVKIVGAVYTTYGATVQSEYNRAAVLSTGNNTITNCYVSNCASAVRVKDGNLEIVNSTIKGGNFANIDIRGGHVILDNVTTINQVNDNDTAKDGTVVVGLGVVVYYENVLNTTTVEIKNGITQYNYLSKTQAATYIKDTTANQLVSVMFNSDYSNVQYSDGSDTWVNAGILSMTSNVGDDNITDVDGYVDASPSMMSVTGYLHTKKPDAASIAATAPEYTTAGQGAIAPSYSFDYTTKNYVAKNDGSNDYCYYEENGTVNISMDAGDTFNWDTSILTATKNGQTLDYTVSMNGTDYTGKSIAFNTAGSYEVVYTYTDSNNYGIDAEGNITTYSKTYTKSVHISVAVIETSAKNAEFTMGSSNAATEKITIDNVTYVSATGVTADNSTWTYITINGQKIYYPIVAAKLTSTKGSSSYAYFPVFENVITITDYADNGTGDAFTYNSSTTTLPSTLTAVKGVYKAASDVPYWYNLTNSNLTQSGASNIFKWASSSAAPSDPTTYNNVLCYKSPQISANRVAYITLVQYSYTDATNTTYYYYVGYTLEAFTYQSTCVTADTLVTLADGTQKRIDQVTYDDQLLVWDFDKGEYSIANSSIIENHGYNTNEVIKLTFKDGTTIKVVNVHGFFDADLNKWVDIKAENASNFIGHSFTQVDGDSYKTVKLVSATVTNEYVEAWSILTADNYNCILEGMFSVTPPATEQLAFFEIGADMKYDAEAKQADIEKYGLYTYDEFAHLMTYEAFDAFNVAEIKIAVGKGLITYEEVIGLIATYA